MSTLRKIGRARFRCEDEGSAWRGRTLLEDAMRTASFGDEGRLLLVRRLDLGRISPGASATEWSRRCEEIFRRLRVDAVPAGSPSAGAANAVVFRDAAALWTMLAVRTIRGTPCVEWFWRAGARDWHPTMTRIDTVRLSFSKLAEGGGLVGTAELGEALQQTGMLGDFLGLLKPEDAAQVLPPAKSQTPAVSMRSHVSPAWLGEIIREVSQRRPEDPCLRWLAAVAVLTTFGEMSPLLAAETADGLLQSVRREQEQPAASRDASPPRETANKVRVLQRNTFGSTVEHTTAAAPGDAERSSTLRPKADPTQRTENASAVDEAPADSDFDPGMPTRFGGLFFLVPILARLGAAQMPPAAAWLALRRILDNAAGKLSDEMQELLPAPVVDDWIPELREPAIAAAAKLAAGVRRACWKFARLSLRTLVHRHGRVAITRTHVDVFLPLSGVDARIRRAALDVDPGWVPWLHRAIQFHYTLDD